MDLTAVILGGNTVPVDGWVWLYASLPATRSGQLTAAARCSDRRSRSSGGHRPHGSARGSSPRAGAEDAASSSVPASAPFGLQFKGDDGPDRGVDGSHMAFGVHWPGSSSTAVHRPSMKSKTFVRNGTPSIRFGSTMDSIASIDHRHTPSIDQHVDIRSRMLCHALCSVERRGSSLEDSSVPTAASVLSDSTNIPR